MSRIRGRNTKPEVLLRKALWRTGLRYRLDATTPSGRPDVLLLKQRIAIFIDGCFWHGCPAHYSRPLSREKFWAAKLVENVERDRKQTAGLLAAGWTVLRFWEHSVFEELDRLVDCVRATVDGRLVELPEDWRVIRVDVVDATARQERRVMERLSDSATKKVVSGPRVTSKWKK